MIAFLYPLWFLGLPLAIVPWFWPIVLKKKHKPIPFSAFLFLPKTTLRRRWNFSIEEWLVKTIRSLIIILLLLILARPYIWDKEKHQEIWVIDDTLSMLFPGIEPKMNNFSQNLIPTNFKNNVLKISELFPKSSTTPKFARKTDQSPAWISPNLAQIEEAIVKKLTSGKEAPWFRVNLISDLQRSQYFFYQSAGQNIEWQFHRPEELPQSSNLSLRKVKINPGPAFSWIATMEIFGETSQNIPLKLVAYQEEKIIGETSVNWENKGSKTINLDLGTKWQHHLPIELVLESGIRENTLDNILYFQQSNKKHLWTAIFSSEGLSGIYRHGLHQLKSALNANQVYSFLNVAADELKHNRPDIILLLGDHPIRWKKQPEGFPKLFIPTRLGDWKSFSQQVSQLENKAPVPFAEDQWVIDWLKVPFAREWEIRRINESLYYSTKWNMWFLATGISPAWGSFYKDTIFADEVHKWLNHILEAQTTKYLGTYNLGQTISFDKKTSKTIIQWSPGHYEPDSQNPKKKLRFSVNIYEGESDPKLMNHDELTNMQNYFDQKAERALKIHAIPSANNIRKWLLWILLMMAGLEIFILLIRIKVGKHEV